MCVTRAAEVISVRTDGKPAAMVSWEGRVMAVDTSLVPDVQPGDRLLIHAGMALERVSVEDQESIDAFLSELDRAFEDTREDTRTQHASTG